MNELYIIITGAFVAASCGILGCFLILRKMAMVGDAISHAVLPGIVLAYLISGNRNSLAMLTGAAIAGLLTTFLIEWFHKKIQLQEDAAIGVSFTSFFAIGVLLISYYAGNIDLDQDCVLYGEIAYVPLDTWVLPSGTDLGPRALWLSGSMFVLIVSFVVLFFKELSVTTFDPAFAAAIGISTTFWHYVLMAIVSLTTVTSFESVGAILVVAFLIAPAATAYLLTDSLVRMIWLAILSGIIASIGGYLLAMYINGSIAGAMSTVCGIEFLLALIFSPTQGIIWKISKKTK